MWFRSCHKWIKVASDLKYKRNMDWCKKNCMNDNKDEWNSLIACDAMSVCGFWRLSNEIKNKFFFEGNTVTWGVFVPVSSVEQGLSDPFIWQKDGILVLARMNFAWSLIYFYNASPYSTVFFFKSDVFKPFKSNKKQ